MYEWIQGRPTVVLRDVDVPRWPGGAIATSSLPRFAAVGRFAGSSVLVLRDPELTTAVPLELGGMLLVTAIYADDDATLGAHLEMLPVTGWEMLPERFVAHGGTYALFDGSLRGRDLEDPARRDEILTQHGGVIRFALEPGAYEVECLGPWDPDEQTSLWLTRLVRAAPNGT